jgi:mRNA-degrading endonuclease RelE of RelBE toxin-antitoxin system
MEKIDKFISKLQRDVAHDVLDILRRIRINDLRNMDIKKLQGHKNEYRTRIGRIRIRFTKTEFGNVITDVGFRDDNTY